MALEFQFEAWGDKLISRRLDRLAGRSVAARPAFEAIADTLRGYEKRLFDSEGASGGRPWEPLAASTVEHKAKAGLDPRILHATHRLRRSLTDKGAAGHLEHATNASLIFGSYVPYGRYHAHGSGSLPKRRPIQFTENQKRYIMKKLQRYVLTGSV
jgi:phage gpG-like protein